MNARILTATVAAALVAANLFTVSPAAANPSDNAMTFPHGSFDADRFSDLVVGAPDEDIDGRANAGAIHILRGSESPGLTAAGSSFITQAMVESDASLVSADARFGAAFAKGQFNDDPYWDLAVGAPGASNGAGLVYVIYGTDAGFDDPIVSRISQNTPGVAGVSEPGDHFGAALAAGDFDNLGGMDLAIGVPDEDIDGAADCGMVNIVYSTPGGLLGSAGPSAREVYQGLNDIDGTRESGDHFGATLTAGDFGNPTSPGDDLAIAVPGENLAVTGGSATNAGMVHVVFGSNSGVDTVSDSDLALTSDIMFAGTVEALRNHEFGFAMTAGRVRGSLVGDDFDDLAVGIPGFDGNRGAVAVFYSDPEDGLDPANWTYSQAMDIDGDDYVRYGAALAAWDFDSDGWDDIAIGAPYQNIAGRRDSGAVYIKRGSFDGVGTSSWMAGQLFVQGGGVVPGANEDDDRFGSSLAVGNFGGPWVHTRLQANADLAIGTPGERIPVRRGLVTRQVLAGAVVTLYGGMDGTAPFASGTGQIWTQNSDGVADAAESFDGFGAAVN